MIRALEPAPPETAAERLTSLWQLAVEAWALSGEPPPHYDRSSMPGKLLRPS